MLALVIIPCIYAPVAPTILSWWLRPNQKLVRNSKLLWGGEIWLVIEDDLIFEDAEDGDAADTPEFSCVCWDVEDDAIGREKPAWFVDVVEAWWLS